MKTKTKPAQTPRQIMKRLTTELGKLGYKTTERSRSPGAEKAWVNSDKPLEWAKVCEAVARVEPLFLLATTTTSAGRIISSSRSFELENQSGIDGVVNQLFVAVKRPTKAGKLWDMGMDV